MFHAWPVFTFLKEGREGEQEIIEDIKEFFRKKQMHKVSETEPENLEDAPRQ